jgi:hypothetical protein
MYDDLPKCRMILSSLANKSQNKQELWLKILYSDIHLNQDDFGSSDHSYVLNVVNNLSYFLRASKPEEVVQKTY